MTRWGSHGMWDTPFSDPHIPHLHVYKGPWKTMHGQIKIKQSSLLLSQTKSFSPTICSTQTYEGVEGNGVWFETIHSKEKFIHHPRSSQRMISDQASFPLAQSICPRLPINNVIHSFSHDPATNHLILILSSPTEFNCLGTCKFKSLFFNFFHRKFKCFFLKICRKKWHGLWHNLLGTQRLLDWLRFNSL